MKSLKRRPPATAAPTEKFLMQMAQARAALEKAESLDVVRSIRNQAKAWRDLLAAQRAGLSMVNQAAETKLRAERRLGELLATMERATPGDATSQARRSIPTLADLGVAHSEAHRWRLLASLPADVFDGFLAREQAEGRELTTAAVLRLAAEMRRRAAGSRPRGRAWGGAGLARPPAMPSLLQCLEQAMEYIERTEDIGVLDEALEMTGTLVGLIEDRKTELA